MFLTTLRTPSRKRHLVKNFRLKPQLLYAFLLIANARAADFVSAQANNWGVGQQSYKQRPSLYPPILKVDSYEGYLPESADVGTTVRIEPSMTSDSLQILVDDQDLKPGMPPAIYQYILTGYGAEKFAVDQRGYLFLNSGEGIDADKSQSTFLLHVLAREVDTEPMRSSEPISLTIHVVDENDNVPSFAQHLYLANVSAGVSEGIESQRTVLRIQAQDLDAGRFGRLTYQIVDVNGGLSTSFRYDQTTQELKAVGPLVPNQRYQVTLEAVDGGGQAGRTTILVHALPDLNTYAAELASLMAQQQQQNHGQVTPIFAVPVATTPPAQVRPFGVTNTYNRRIVGTSEPSDAQAIEQELNEASPPNSVVVTLGDETTRGKTYFRIVDGNEERRFTINSDTGTVTTVLPLDRELNDAYSLTIEARSRYPDQLLYVTLLQVSITDTNDNAPQFLSSQPMLMNIKYDSQFNTLPPNMKLGVVGVKDEDKDENGRVSLRIVPPMNRLYTISDNGDLRINGEFKAEHLGEHKLAVIAFDHGNPPLETRGQIVVNIEGSSNLAAGVSTPAAPQIPSIADGLRSGSSSGSSNSASGSASASSSSVDYYESAAAAGSDELRRNGVASPQSPFFSRATLPPNTEQPPFTRMDPRNGQFQSMLNSLTSNPQASQLPYPGQGNNARPAQTPQTPIVGANRLAPVFTTPVITVVVEENEEDLELCTLEAKYPDGEGGEVTYFMQAGDESLFSINSTTGKLNLIKALDAEAEQSYSIRIGTLESMDTQAMGLRLEPSLPHSASITVQVVDVNDWIPNFEQDIYEFKIIDRAEPDTIVGQVTAYDQDAKPPNNNIRYRLYNTDGLENFFSVDEASGMIKLAKEVNQFGGQKLELKVEAIDEGEVPQSTNTIVKVEVERSAPTVTVPPPGVVPAVIPTGSQEKAVDFQEAIRFEHVNYSATIREGSRAPDLIQTLRVMNKPADARFIQCAIASGNFRGAFHVPASADGDCELRTMFELDRESVERYLLNVTVQHGLQIDSALVSVHVTDQNDNPPKFVYPPMGKHGLDLNGYFAVVSSLAGSNTKVVTVRAEDADLGNNSLIHYELDPVPVDAKYFSIDRVTGEIRTRKRMQEISSKSRKSHYDVRVIACDTPEINAEKLCSKAQVFINQIGDQHRFLTVLRGAQPQQIREHEEDIAKAIRQFTGLCSWVAVEGMADGESKSANGNMMLGSASNGEPVSKVYWYAANPSTKRVCRRQDFRRLFNSTAREQLAAKLQQWFTLEDLREVANSDTLDTFDQDTAWLPIDWKSASTVLILISIGVAVVALFALCAIFIFRSRHRKGAKRGRSMARHGHNYPTIYPMPKYNANVYLPTINHQGTMERENKFYETQMLELPISDEDFTLLKQNNSRTANFGYGRPVSTHQNQFDGGVRNPGTISANNTNLSSLSMHHQMYSGASGNGSGIPFSSSSAAPKRQIGGGMAMARSMYAQRQMNLNNQEEGDFSIEESMYAINPALNGHQHHSNPSKLVF